MSLRGDRYELLRPIAAGGMATVHLARSLGAGGFERLVAVKVMHPHLAGETEFVSMFLDEARLAARIRHPNVVATLDVQTDDQGVFLVMEYVEGPSLDKVLRTLFSQGKRIPIEIIIKIFLDVLAGLDAAHELKDASGEPLNLVHRDVSPQNVLIGADGIARLTDFGVARAEARLSQRTQTGQLKGKVSYMSPEQAMHAPLDRRSDIYAAGIVLWEVLTNQRLLREPTELLTLLKAKEAEHKSPREYDALVPTEISDVCMMALRKNPKDRFPTAAAFAEALETAAANEGIAIATTRAVGALITNCRAHTTAAELMASASSATPSVPAMVARKAAAEAANNADNSSNSGSPKNTEGLSESNPGIGASTSTNAPSSIPMQVPTGAARSSLVPRIAAGAVVLAAIAAFSVWQFQTSRGAPALAPTSEQPKPTVTSTGSTPAIVPLDPATAAPATSAPSAPSSTVANVSSASNAVPLAPTLKGTAKPAKTSKVEPVYRPPEL